MTPDEGTEAPGDGGAGGPVVAGRRAPRRRSAPGTWWPPGDESGWEEYHRQMYDLDAETDGFARWKIKSSGVNVARQVASARNRGLAAWVRTHGEDPAGWPLGHPPAVLWVPYVARAACLGCWWLSATDFTSVDTAAAACRRHTRKHAAAGDDAVLLEHLLAPLPVWQPYGGRDRNAPRTTG